MTPLKLYRPDLNVVESTPTQLAVHPFSPQSLEQLAQHITQEYPYLDTTAGSGEPYIAYAHQRTTQRQETLQQLAETESDHHNRVQAALAESPAHDWPHNRHCLALGDDLIATRVGHDRIIDRTHKARQNAIDEACISHRRTITEAIALARSSESRNQLTPLIQAILDLMPESSELENNLTAMLSDQTFTHPPLHATFSRTAEANGDQQMAYLRATDNLYVSVTNAITQARSSGSASQLGQVADEVDRLLKQSEQECINQQVALFESAPAHHAILRTLRRVIRDRLILASSLPNPRMIQQMLPPVSYIADVDPNEQISDILNNPAVRSGLWYVLPRHYEDVDTLSPQRILTSSSPGFGPTQETLVRHLDPALTQSLFEWLHYCDKHHLSPRMQPETLRITTDQQLRYNHHIAPFLRWYEQGKSSVAHSMLSMLRKELINKRVIPTNHYIPELDAH